MRPDNQHRSGSLETDPSLDADDRIAHVHITADTVSGPDLLDLLDSGDLILEHLTIHGMNLTVLELDAQLLAAGLLHLFQISALGQSLRGIKNLATADRGSPKTYVIGIFQLREIGLETVLLQVVDLFLAAQGHIAGQRDNLHVRSQYQESHIETDLVVTGSGRTMGDSVGANLVRVAGDRQGLEDTLGTYGDRIRTITQHVSENHVLQALLVILFRNVDRHVFRGA